MNADTSLNAAGIEIEAALDSAERYVYTVSYLQTSNSVNKAGTVSQDGVVYATFGTGWDGALIELTAAVNSASDGATQLATNFRTAINNTSEYNATLIATGPNANKSFYVTRNVSGTASTDRSPLMAAAPKLDIVIDAAMASTTAVLGNDVAGFQTASYLSNTFASKEGTFSLADITPVKQSNLRITLRDTTGLGFNSAVTLTAASTANSNTAITVGTTTNTGTVATVPYLLVDGVSIVSASENTSTSATDDTATTYYVASGPAAGTKNVTTDGVTAVTTDRTSWL